jgi:hypothetical protein
VILGVQNRLSHDHDDAGQRVASRVIDSTGLLASTRYEYDPGGRLVRLVVTDQRGATCVPETYQYGDRGEKKKTFHVGVLLQDEKVATALAAGSWSYGCEGTDAAYSAPGAATVTTQYNTAEQPTELLFSDSHGRPLSRVDFLYDDAGRLVEEAQIRFEPCLPPEALEGMSPAQLEAVRQLLGPGAPPSRRLHRYDSRGHRIETSGSGLFGRDVTRVAYNDWGDPMEVTSEFDGRGDRYNIDDQGQVIGSAPQERLERTETRYHYDYDARGNWIRKIVQSRGSAVQDFSTSSVEERTLSYYD